MKIDFHCHLFKDLESREALERDFKHFEDYGFYERIKQGLTQIDTIETNDILEKTLFHIKNARLDKVVLLPVTLSENLEVQKWYNVAPDIFIPFYNPPEKEPIDKKSYEIMETLIKEDKIKGFKIMSAFREKSLNNKLLTNTLKLAQKNNLIVLIHTGYPPPGTKRNVLSFSNPLEIDEIVQSFPKIKIIIAHMGYPWVDIALALAVQYPNIYVDISNLTYMIPNRLREFIIHAKELIGTSKILFGSDGFVPEMIEVAVRYFENINYLSQEDVTKIMGLNAQKLLKL